MITSRTQGPALLLIMEEESMSLLWVHVPKKFEGVLCATVLNTMVSTEIKSCDYYIVDQIVYTLSNGRCVKVDRSRIPRWFSSLPPQTAEGKTREQQIEEEEDLVTRVLFESGTFHISEWESDLYRSEFDTLTAGLSFTDVRKITREIVYRIR